MTTIFSITKVSKAELNPLQLRFISSNIKKKGRNYGFYLVEFCFKEEKISLELLINFKIAYLGLWMRELSIEVLNYVEKELFRLLDVNKIIARGSITNYGLSRSRIEWYVELPSNTKELHSRLSKKFRYNITREERIISSLFKELHFQYLTSVRIEPWIIKKFIEYKRHEYILPNHYNEESFLIDYPITGAYLLFADDYFSKKDFLAIIFEIHHDKFVFLENLTYNPVYKKYSVGKHLYFKFIEYLINERFKVLFLLGGDLEYKKKFGSQKKIVYDVYIFRFKIIKLGYSIFFYIYSTAARSTFLKNVYYHIRQKLRI